MSAAGIYGVIAYTTSQRTQEIGIRMALGATPRYVRGLVFRDGFTAVAIGLILGLGITAAAACWLPSRKAAVVDPMTALRVD